jgi:hypothetical protein
MIEPLGLHNKQARAAVEGAMHSHHTHNCTRAREPVSVREGADQARVMVV